MIKYFLKHNGISSIYIVFEGSNLESSSELGCAHLLEHLMCLKFKDLEEEFISNGIEFNASTDPNYTMYYLKGLDEKIQEYAQVFYDRLVCEPLSITKEDFLKEKRIVLQEWNETLNNPIEKLYFNFYMKHYNSPRTIGVDNVIEKFRLTDLEKMYEEKYKKPVFCLIENLGKWKIEDRGTEFRTYHDSPFSFSETNKKVFIPKSKENFKDYLILSEEFNDNVTEHFVINEILSSGLTSPLYKALRDDEQIVYGISGGFEIVNNYFFHNAFITNTNKKNKDKLWKAFSKVINNSEVITKERFDNCIKKLNIEMEIDRRRDSSPIQSFLNPVEALVEEEINKIKFENLKRFYKEWYSARRFEILD